ncbi:lipopolysaccharide assembly protein LapA domain-containing protein [Leptothoe sp. PORK10 BA2]|uniref:lipopolysaccharide assembly protein LapA domain-containing protein n=1 Tax=Leptothoe sp. PORK10 BA2 TaxID=3110254 RepID=UPI002B21058B|nr:lipopolysaccharide assembly protein LapA domain-containing protein [Leptothoe sp. PORK10 BA2]MEA5465586.1 lipopolysaccharide assembly protein LapA domain-containing protein [Leptothoe sp. PORK10 BA2]
MALFLIFALVIAFFAIAFALQNDQLITINFFLWQLERQHLATVLLLTSGLGVVFGLLVTIPTFLKREWRISRTKRQASSLETQLLAKQQEVNSQARQASTLRHSHQNLLRSLDLLDHTTGLVNDAVVPRTTRALLQQMKMQPLNPEFQSVGLLIIKPHRRQPNASDLGGDLRKDQALWSAISHVLQQNLTVDAWLFSDNQGTFTCSLTGLDVKAITQYAETLKTFLTEAPLSLKDGTQTTLDVHIGGAVTDKDHPTESEKLLMDKAEEALALATKRGRNRLRVMWVTDKLQTH